MTSSKWLTWIVPVTAVLIVFAAGMGVFWQDGGQSYNFTTLHNDVAQIYGQGLYHYDTTIIAVGYRIGDAYTLLAGIPFLLTTYFLYRRGSLRAGLLMGGTLAFLLYEYASFGFGAAYNNLFLAYTLITLGTVLGLFLFIRSVDQAKLSLHFDTRKPQRGAGIFLIVGGVILFLIWLLLSILPALFAGKVPPELGSYSTVPTFVIDMSFVAPSMIGAGILWLRREALGRLLAPILLVFTDALGLGLMIMGAGQMAMGLMSMGQFFGFVVSFAILTILSIGYTIALFRTISD